MILDFHSVTLIIIHFAIFNACVVLFQIPILSEQQKTVNSSFFNFVHFWKKESYLNRRLTNQVTLFQKTSSQPHQSNIIFIKSSYID